MTSGSEATRTQFDEMVETVKEILTMLLEEWGVEV